MTDIRPSQPETGPTPSLPMAEGVPQARSRITASDLWDIARAAPRVVYTASIYRFLGLYRGARWVFPRASHSAAAGPAIDVAMWQRRTIAIRRVAWRIPDAHCIVRASTLAAWMQGAGLPARVVAGVPADFTRAPGRIGHAWVECGPHVFDDPIDGAHGLKLVDTGRLFAEAKAGGAGTPPRRTPSP